MKDPSNHKAPAICIFSALYAPSMGGVETYTQNLAAALDKMGCKVTVAAMHSHGGEKREQHGNVEVVRLPCISALGGRYPVPKHDKAYRQAMEHLTNTAPDYVVVNMRFYPLSLEGLKFARKQGITPVLVEHGSAHLSMGSPTVNIAVEAVEHALHTA